jgi:quinol monooxygenase YgiN
MSSEGKGRRIAVVGTLRASHGLTQSVLEAMEIIVASSRAEDGCEQYYYASDVLDLDLIRVFEIWRDRNAFLTHRGMPHLAAWRAKWPELGLGDAALVTYEIDNEAPV